MATRGTPTRRPGVNLRRGTAAPTAGKRELRKDPGARDAARWLPATPQRPERGTSDGLARRGTDKPAAAAAAAQDQIDRTLAMLIEHDRRDAESRKAIGKHLFEAYFGGDERLARSKDPRKKVSFNALARRAKKETNWDGTDLYDAIIQYLVARTLPAWVASALKPTYLGLLDSVEGEARLLIAQRIARKELRGQAALKAIFDAGGHRRGGRIPRPRPLQAALEMERLRERFEKEGAFDKAAFEQIYAAAQLADTIALLDRHAAKIQGYAAAVREVLRMRG